MAGTIIGAVVGSVVATVATAIYAHSIRTATVHLRVVRPGDTVGLPGVVPVLLPADPGLPGPSDLRQRHPDQRHPDQRRSWLRLTSGLILGVVLALAAVTVVETIIGHPLSDSSSSGTSIGHAVTGSGSSGTPQGVVPSTLPSTSGGSPTTSTPVTSTPSSSTTTSAGSSATSTSTGSSSTTTPPVGGTATGLATVPAAGLTSPPSAVVPG